MSKLSELRHTIDSITFPSQFKHFGGAELIITNDKNRGYREGDTVIYTNHASALSWLVVQLKEIYKDEIHAGNKYDFYPLIGQLIQESLTNEAELIDSMLYVVDEIEKAWGSK
ncbi:MAG: hypothetical protein RI922_1835 [Bacteroidota bacterium]|jgi:hypothetical protein